MRTFINRKTAFWALILLALAACSFSMFGCGATPPSILNISVSPSVVTVGTTAVLSCESSTVTGKTLTYTWSVTGGTLSSTSGQTVNWTAPTTTGTYVVTVSVSDGSQVTNSTLNIVVIASTLTIVGVTVSPSAVVIPETTVTLSCEATTPTSYPITYIWTATKGTLTSNTGKMVSWIAPSTVGICPITVTVSDTMATQTNTTSITVSDNPVINSLTATPITVVVNKTSVLSCDASDPSDPTGADLEYTWAVSGGGSISSTIGKTVTYTAPSSVPSTPPQVTVTVKKGALSTSATATINVIAATAPVIQDINPSLPSTIAQSTSYSLKCNVVGDPSGTIYQYKWTTSSGGILNPDSGYQTTWTSPATITSGTTFTITVTVTDTVSGASSTATTSSVFP